MSQPNNEYLNLSDIRIDNLDLQIYIITTRKGNGLNTKNECCDFVARIAK